jgi:3-oxoacyl-[acyl-carrier protein] reductase
MATYGSLDMLVNNTGINPVYGSLLDVDHAVAAKMVDTNVLATMAWVKACRDVWMGIHGGAVVNVSSVAGLSPSPGIGWYGATKAMLSRVTSELAVELAPGIRVNAVAPAVVKTKFAGALYEGREEKVAASYPLRRLGRPEDVASLVWFLLSDEASWITGQTITVDGGLTLKGGMVG